MTSSNSQRIAKNTLMLYFRHILIMAVSLYTVRVVLSMLGAEAYGTYNVVAGIVAMFSFLTSVISNAAQRYFSYDLGAGQEEQLKETFTSILLIFIIIIIFVLVIAETLGLWFINNKLVVLEEFKNSVPFVYQFSLLSFIFVMLVSPFLASILAHEDMKIYAWVSIFEAGAKLLLAFLLSFFHDNRLVAYSFMLMSISFALLIIYAFICIKKYSSCRLVKKINKKRLFEIFSFMGWNLFGSLSGVLKNQGVNILINQFFNPVVNAARSVAMQINAAVSSFAVNFSSALNPQIVKQYADKNYSVYYELVCRGAKYTFLLMWIFILPLINCMPFVLSVWLKDVPVKTVIFADLVLIKTLIEAVIYPLLMGVQATGRVRNYQIILGFLFALTLPISWILFKLGFDAEWVFIVGTLINLLALFIRYLFLNGMTKLPFSIFLTNTIFPIFKVVILPIIAFLIWNNFFNNTPVFEILGTCILFFVVVINIYILGFDDTERNKLKTWILEKLKK